MKSLEASVQASMKSHQGGKRRKGFDTGFRILCQVTATMSVVILAVLLYSIFSSGLTHLSFRFLTSPPHPDPDKAGVWPALMGTVWTCAACAVLTSKQFNLTMHGDFNHLFFIIQIYVSL